MNYSKFYESKKHISHELTITVRCNQLLKHCALHRSHLYAIPYENLDIHLGRKLTLDPDHIYHKIVEERRGGWCYEMNGLFSQALRQMGFDVTLLGSSVGSPAQGGVDGDLDHLILLVQVDKQPWLADVGFGKGLLIRSRYR